MRSMLMAPIGRPSRSPISKPIAIGRPVPPPASFDDSELRRRLKALEERRVPQFDPTALQQSIAGLQDQISTLPRFDDSTLRDRLKALESREIPVFDPSELKTGIAGLQDQFANLKQFDPSNLQRQIGGLQDRIANFRQFDDSALRNRLQALEGREMPRFDDTALKNRLQALEGREIPQFDPTQLQQGIAGLEDRLANIPQFDPSNLQSQIGGLQDRLANLPQFDDTALRDRLQALESREIPQFDPSQLQAGIQGLSDRISNIPQFDPSALQNRLSALENRQTPTFNPEDFREQFLNIAREGIDIPQPTQAFDPSGLQNRLQALENREIPQFDPSRLQERLSALENVQPVAPTPAFDPSALQARLDALENREPVTVPPAFDPSGLMARLDDFESRLGALQQPLTPTDLEPQPPNETPTPPMSIGGPRRGVPEPPGGGRPTPPMSIGGPGGGVTDMLARLPGGPISVRDDLVFPGGSPTFNERGETFVPPDDEPSPPPDPVGRPQDLVTTGPDNIGGAPSLVDQQMQQGAIDPVLLNQQASEVLTDPLIRSLYFGTADQPGFFQQLQQAGANLIGSDVPLQQTAGLSPLELLARQQAVAGLGGFEPFLQQNRELINQAIEQSRRAEGLQDPYYTQAEEIFKDTMGAYDPSMTQQFFNPFEDAVVQQTIDDVLEAGEQQDIAARAQEIGSGAFGGSRARLGAMERREALGEGLAQALGNIRQRGFSEAQQTGLSEFARQQAAKRAGAQGLIGIGVGRGSAAQQLGQQLAGYGGQMGGLGVTQEQLRAGQRGELAGFGGVGRGIAETGLARIFQQQLAQQQRPLGVLGQIASMLPGYQQSRTQIDSQYGMPTDPTAAGLGAAFSAYGALAPRQGSG